MANKVININAITELPNIITEDIKSKIDTNKPKAYTHLVDTVIKDTDQFVPYKNGSLSKNIEKNPTGYSYNTNYASYAFNPIAPSGVPKNYTKTTHIQAQGNPVDVSEREYAKKWADQYANDILQGLR